MPIHVPRHAGRHIVLNHSSPFRSPSPLDERSIDTMSSTRCTVTPTSNFQLIIKALHDYAKQTGIDLAEHPSAKQLELLDSPDAILRIFQERENAFRKFPNRNLTLINCLRPTVKTLHAFSGVIGEAASPVSQLLCLYFLFQFNAISPGSSPMGKSYSCWNRCSTCCTC